MAAWYNRPWLAVDTETTGVDPWTDRVVELGAVMIAVDGTPSDALHLIVNPGIDIPEGASDVHGISNERAQSEGCRPIDMLRELADRIWAAGPGCPVVMFNARFDWPLLIAEAERYGIEFPMFAPVLDPFLIDKMLDKYRKGSRKLTAVAEHYGVELGDAAHGAIADATAGGQVMRALVELYPALKDYSLASLYVRQVHGQFIAGESFAEYMRGKGGQPDFVHTPGWPIPVGPLTTFTGRVS